ncbi:YqhV family protein [Rummeliibacillus sp. JY-2-4R]
MDKSLLMMVILRIMSGSLEVTAALFMLKFNSLEKAFYINTMLALVGPTVLIVTTAIALFGLADKISIPRMICLFAGITLILVSLNTK